MRLKNRLSIMILLTLLTFSFSVQGCSQTTKYIKSPCPKLTTFKDDANQTLLKEKLKLSVPFVDDNATKLLLETNARKYGFLKTHKWGFVRLDKLKDISFKMQTVKAEALNCLSNNKLYTIEIIEFNRRF